MKYAFDLISDLYLTKDTVFTWKQCPTSLFCVVAGNVSSDRQVLRDTLTHLGQCYSSVLYIDGPLEHYGCLDNLTVSYDDLAADLGGIPNVVFLHNHVVLMGDTAFLATNGWWSYDFDPGGDYDQAIQWEMDEHHLTQSAAESIHAVAVGDAKYMIHSLQRLQRHVDVNNVVAITGTVPNFDLVSHDIELQGTHRMGTLGNAYMAHASRVDTEKKLSTWCFGSYTGNVDFVAEGVHYLNNARGDAGSSGYKSVYHPLRIELNQSRVRS